MPGEEQDCVKFYVEYVMVIKEGIKFFENSDGWRPKHLRIPDKFIWSMIKLTLFVQYYECLSLHRYTGIFLIFVQSGPENVEND